MGDRVLVGVLLQDVLFGVGALGATAAVWFLRHSYVRVFFEAARSIPVLRDIGRETLLRAFNVVVAGGLLLGVVMIAMGLSR